MTDVFASLAGGGLLSLLIAAGFGFGFALVAGQPRRRAAITGAACAIALGVALSASPVFRANMAGSLSALFFLSLFALPVLFYAVVLRRVRARADGPPPPPPEPGLRLIEDDAALFSDRLVALNAENARQRGFWRDRFSVAWRDADGAIVGSVRVTIVMGLAEFHALHVDEAARGAGIGTALLTGAQDEARSRGATHGILHTFSWQVPGFYTGHGWQEVRRIPLDAGTERIEFERPL